jgi:diguanylate cyclase (GGDEF)-like protein
MSEAGEAQPGLSATDWWLAAAVGALEEHVYFGLLHPDGAYEELFAGPNLDRLLGGSPPPGESYVATWRRRIEADDLPAYFACEAELRAGLHSQVSYRVLGLDGKTRWIQARVHPEQLADGTVRFAGILSDITEERQAEARLRAALTQLAEANAQLDAARAHAVELSRTDALTGAANRRYVDDVLGDTLARGGTAFGVLLLDIDDFKLVNDRHGHRVGDDVLIELVTRLQAAVRDRDIIARWGGEEFLLLCRTGKRERLRAITERIRTAVCNRPFATSVGELAVTISIGAVSSGGVAQSADALVDAADAALLAAKLSGKNRTVIKRRPRAPRIPTDKAAVTRAVSSSERVSHEHQRGHATPQAGRKVA